MAPSRVVRSLAQVLISLLLPFFCMAIALLASPGSMPFWRSLDLADYILPPPTSNGGGGGGGGGSAILESIGFPLGLPVIMMTVLLCFAINWVAWFLAAVLRTEKFYDTTGMLTFLAVIGMIGFTIVDRFDDMWGALVSPILWRRWLPALLVASWTLRLGIFLTVRIWFVAPGGVDTRFDKIRGNPFALLVAFSLQATWAFLCCLPMMVQMVGQRSDGGLSEAEGGGQSDLATLNLNSALPRTNFEAMVKETFNAFPLVQWLRSSALAIDVIPLVLLLVRFSVVEFVGLYLWTMGLAFEFIADVQKFKFSLDRQRAGGAHPRGEEDGNGFIRHGLWAWSRHPNYVGEIVMWFGMFLLSWPHCMEQPTRFVAVLCPLLVYFLLTRVSGCNYLEPRAFKKWGHLPAYQKYLATTPELWPIVGRKGYHWGKAEKEKEQVGKQRSSASTATSKKER